MKKKVLGIIFSLVAGAAFGYLCGGIMVSVIKRNIAQQSSAGETIFLCGVFFVCLIAGFIFHIILHEIGHLLFGKLSGYDFVSFRIFNLMFIKENGKVVRKKFNIVGTGGQCLMSPPEPVNGEFPYILYNLGGSFMNFILSGICYIFYRLLSESNPFCATMFALFAVIGLLSGLFNIIPLKIGGIANDGFNALTLCKREKARHAFWLQLCISALITEGTRLRDMPAEWFDMPEDSDLNDVMIASIAVFRFSYLIDRHEFTAARKLAEHLLITADKMLEVHKNEMRCELLFLEIINECRKEEINCLYNRQLKNYINATRTYVSRQRLLYAYARLVSHDAIEAEKALKQFNKSCNTYPQIGEIVGERELIDLIDSIAVKEFDLL